MSDPTLPQNIRNDDDQLNSESRLTGLGYGFLPTFRQKEIAAVVHWVEAGESGVLLGLAGSGKADLLYYLCRHPQVIQPYLIKSDQTIAPVAIDLHLLPAYNDLTTFYRAILRAFYEACDHFSTHLQQLIVDFYQHNKHEQDPFPPQSDLRQLLALIEAEKVRVALVANHFDHFCARASSELFDAFFGLHNSFNTNLCFLLSMNRAPVDLSEPVSLGKWRSVLTGHICWVGSLTEQDARQMIKIETYIAPQPLNQNEVTQLLTLTGQYPSLLKAACRWWRNAANKPSLRQWAAFLLADPGIQFQLTELWASLTQEEQLILRNVAEARRNSAAKTGLISEVEYYPLLSRLAEMGLCYKANNCWQIKSELLADFVVKTNQRGRGRIWQSKENEHVWQGLTELELSLPQAAALRFFLRHPYRQLSKADMMREIWPDEWPKVEDSRLDELIWQLRRRLEPDPIRPCYLVNGGQQSNGCYQFFPEGRAR